MTDFEERPRKVHMFKDQKGATYKSCGDVRKYADTICKGNFSGPGLLTTNDPKKVTCTICLRKMQNMKKFRDDMPPPPRPFLMNGINEEALKKAGEEIARAARQMADRLQRVRPPEDPSLERLLGEEVEHANHLAEVLRYALSMIEDDKEHVIAVLGTQITVGQVIRGTLAKHDQLRERVDDDG